MTLFKATLAALVIGGASFPAMAGSTCKDINVIVNNHTGHDVKIIDLDYYDPSDRLWRSVPTKNEVVHHNRPWQRLLNLKKVNEMNVRLRVEYREPKSGGWGKWGKKQSKLTSRQICSRGKEYLVTLR